MIVCKNVKKYYGKNNTLCKALDGLFLHIFEGELVAIMGKSGSGKSTLLNLLAALAPQTEGEIVVDNMELSALSDKQKAEYRRNTVGTIHQSFALIEQYTVLENILLALTFNKAKKSEKRKRIIEELNKLNIGHLLNKKVSKLSGGEKQRVAIVRALINDPKIILCDEPTGSLDSQNAKQVLEILKDINKNGKTIVLVTHDEGLAAECNRTITIVDGIIV
jgi:putative ABC transport system ATP-binding protein